MGMFDTVDVYMKCPACKRHHMIDAQTKNLHKQLFTFTALPAQWHEKDAVGSRYFRTQFPTTQQFPLDKSNTVWQHQAERAEAAANTCNKELQYIDVVFTCPYQTYRDGKKHEMFFDGKIKVQDGLLISPIYDIEQRDWERLRTSGKK